MLFCIFFVAAQPLRSTLFPYTTLFRSKSDALGVGLVLEGFLESGVEVADIGIRIAHDFAVELQPNPQHAVRAGVLDRKSTRLNSSHTVISYAVFCLKKKTQQFALIKRP